MTVRLLSRLLTFALPAASPPSVATTGRTGEVVDEHFVPRQGLSLEPYLAAEDICGIHHLARYHWAADVLRQRKPRRVLDFTCGAGYGAYLLAEALPEAEVVGADYDKQALEEARRNYQRPNMRYIYGDIMASGCYDAIISFDTIEHVPHREIMMQKIVDSLSEDGCLLLSTPVPNELKLNPEWECHCIEYSPEALYDFLARYFHTILLPDNGTLPCMGLFTNVVNSPKVRYPTRMNPLVCENPIRITGPWERVKGERVKGSERVE